MGYFEKALSKQKLLWIRFGQLLKKIGLLLIPTAGHTYWNKPYARSRSNNLTRSVFNNLSNRYYWRSKTNAIVILIEQASSRIFYPFQNKHQIHWHLQIVKMLCPIKNQYTMEVIKWARLTAWPIYLYLNNAWLDIFHLSVVDALQWKIYLFEIDAKCATADRPADTFLSINCK